MTATRAPQLLQKLAAERRNPSEQLMEELIRLRKRGFPFELAWKRAWRSITWPQTKETRQQWKGAIEACKDYTERCYRNEGVRVTLDQIVEAMSSGTDLEDAPAAVF